MATKRIYYLGFLANVDSSIIKMKLDYGFEIKDIAEQECRNLLSAIDKTPEWEGTREVRRTFPCFNESEEKYYCISNSFEVPVDDEHKRAKLGGRFSEEHQEFDKLLREHVESRLTLMRLYKAGNIDMPLSHYYELQNGIPTHWVKSVGSYYLREELYTLEDSDIEALNKFIEAVKLPFSLPFLQLAFSNFQLSFYIRETHLSFLSLMIALEALFNAGTQELTHRLSRCVAVLLGNSKADSKSVLDDLKKNLYSKRSKIVHTGKQDVVTEDDLLKLRHYVRESIKDIYRIGMNSKEELLDLLESHGFGDREKLFGQ